MAALGATVLSAAPLTETACASGANTAMTLPYSPILAPP
jgi:hypothetical protein